MTTSGAALRWTMTDLEGFPQPLDDTRYEIIDGELYVSTQPNFEHQFTATRLAHHLSTWSDQAGLGMALGAPGVIFADDENIAPDVVWLSWRRLGTALKSDGKLHDVPELMVEVLSPGTANERRDRDAKLKLYARRGVDEYWILDWQQRFVERYRRAGERLLLVATLRQGDDLTSPLLPGFSVAVGALFFTPHAG